MSPAWREPCDDLENVLSKEGSPWGDDGRWVLTNGPDVAPLKSRLYQRHPLVVDQPVPRAEENADISWIGPFGHRDIGTWRRWHSGADGLVDWSEFCFTPEYRHSVAATTLEVDQAEWRTLEVSSTGPFALFVDGELALCAEDFSYMEPMAHELRLRLKSGTTSLLLATWQVAFREVRHIARVMVRGLPLQIVVPSPSADEHASALAENVLSSVSVESWALRDATVRLRGPNHARLVIEDDRGRRERVQLVDGTATLALGLDSGARQIARPGASMLDTGEVRLRVSLDDNRCPVYRLLDVAVLPAYRSSPTNGGPAQWRQELLEHVASRRPSVARALAHSSLGERGVTDDDVEGALAMLRERADCADFQAVGLMHLWHRSAPEEWAQDLQQQVKETLLGFKYWIDQPGLDAMCYFTENHQFVFHTAEILAGEAFQDEVFTNTGWTGSRHAQHGTDLARAWLRRKLRGGFSEFESNAYVAIDVLALVSLVEYAQDDSLRAEAEALLDKLLFSLAANSWHGIHGAAHGRSYAQMLHSSRFEETGPLMWGLFGVGALNDAVLPATCLATARRYQLPEVIREVASPVTEPWWARQVYRGQYRMEHDLLTRPYRSDVRVWKTANVMLSSVQDYRHGLPGLQEHSWGATLSPEVQVFATNPATDSESSSARPNAWAGQRILPRVRQDRDVVVVLYPRSSDGGLLPTHIWFPRSWMDEVAFTGDWLVGRVGSGYVAICSAGGFDTASDGPLAGQEWRPKGDGRAYVVVVGDEVRSGSFAAFTASLHAPRFASAASDEATVSLRAPDGRTISCSWSGAFLVDNVCPDLDARGELETELHIDNPACRARFSDERITISSGESSLTLDVVAGRRVHATTAQGGASDRAS